MIESRTGLSRSLAIGAVMAAVACAPSSRASSTSRTPADQGRAAVRPNGPIHNVCEGKVIAPDDLVSVLRGTITAKTVPGDPQTCEFSSESSSSVSITVRPGLGEVTVSDWSGGKLPFGAAAVNGIGDLAVWQSTLHELIATRRNVLCDIGSHGTTGTEADLEKKFGQLCDKIWAAQR